LRRPLDPPSAAIAFARRGIYPPGALKSVPAPILARYFVKSDGAYEAIKPLRAMMTFGEHDLGARVPFPRIDLVLCRNVLIYFTLAMQRVALETFAFSLRDDGRLVLGPSETVAALPESYARNRRASASTADCPASRPSPWPDPRSSEHAAIA